MLLWVSTHASEGLFLSQSYTLLLVERFQKVHANNSVKKGSHCSENYSKFRKKTLTQNLMCTRCSLEIYVNMQDHDTRVFWLGRWLLTWQQKCAHRFRTNTFPRACRRWEGRPNSEREAWWWGRTGREPRSEHLATSSDQTGQNSHPQTLC